MERIPANPRTLPEKNGTLLKIPRKAVSSSTIRNIGYDEARKVLTVEFWSKAAAKPPVWAYFPISPETYEKLMGAESIGSEFHKSIKTNEDLQSRKIDGGSKPKKIE